jgi:hypothetical protein
VGDASQKFATTAFVTNAISSATTGVASFNTRTGAVTLQLADVVGVGGAPLAGPAFTGTPTAPTPTGGDNSTKLATTAYVTSAITASASGVTTFNGRNGAVTLQLTDVTTVGGAPIASPTFTGSPLSTTPAPADNSTRLATTAYVVNALVPYALTSSLAVGSAAAPLMNGTAAAGSSAAWSHGDHVHPTDTTRYAASNPAGYQTAAQVSASLGAYVPLTGAVTITGSMNMQGITCTGLNVGGGAIVAGDISGTFIHASGNLQTSSAVVFGADLQNYISSDSGGTVMYVNGGNNYWSYTKATGYWQWVVNGAVTMQLQYTPGLLINGPAYKPGGGVWSDSSDARIKTIKGAYATGLDAISQLNPVNFTYKGNDTSEPPAQVDSSKSDEPVTVPYPNSMHRHAAESGTIYHGLIAQEVETVFPEMITKRDGYIDGVAVTDIRTIDATPLIYALVNAVKELAARVETLEAAL